MCGLRTRDFFSKHEGLLVLRGIRSPASTVRFVQGIYTLEKNAHPAARRCAHLLVVAWLPYHLPSLFAFRAWGLPVAHAAPRSHVMVRFVMAPAALMTVTPCSRTTLCARTRLIICLSADCLSVYLR